MPTLLTLTWLDQADPRAPLAPFTLDFTQGNTWQFNSLEGAYHFQGVRANGVLIDNTQINVAVVVTYGPAVTVVPAFARAAIDLPHGIQSISFICTSPVQVPIEFYVVKPTPETLTNYAAATVNANPTQNSNSVFLNGNVPLVINTRTNILDTGVIGDVGQKWLLAGNITITDAAAGSNFQAMIQDTLQGIDVIDFVQNSSPAAAPYQTQLAVPPVVALLTGPTRFRLQARSSTGNSTVLSTGGALSANLATWLTFVRLS